MSGFQSHINLISTLYQPRLKFGQDINLISTMVRVSTLKQRHDFNLISTNVRVSTLLQRWNNQGWYLVEILTLFQHWNDVDNLSTRFQPDINSIATNIACWDYVWYIDNMEASIINKEKVNMKNKTINLPQAFLFHNTIHWAQYIG